MGTQALTREGFEQTVTSNGIVFVDFWAWWRGSWRMFARVTGPQPRSRVTSSSPGGYRRGAGTGRGRAGHLHPEPEGLRIGIVVVRHAGALPAAPFEEVVDRVRALDMNNGPAQLDAQPQSATA